MKSQLSNRPTPFSFPLNGIFRLKFQENPSIDIQIYTFFILRLDAYFWEALILLFKYFFCKKKMNMVLQGPGFGHSVFVNVHPLQIIRQNLPLMKTKLPEPPNILHSLPWWHIKDICYIIFILKIHFEGWPKVKNQSAWKLRNITKVLVYLKGWFTNYTMHL